MADLKRERLGEGEALLKKLRRLRLRAATAGKDDRAQLLALMDDIETVRRKLLRECALLDEELKVAAVRVTAANTYARVAQTSRRPQREH
ncbi:hypothetical protein S58_28050 [Bradyrhizobium oligotrophicum S58]|uniref:Uncharacterized protein n=1 Tax=Bradyrhizobium oligotrophicum S58 TaxID=1245469 RepID=M4Z6U9_9BRAD|nr:hypothetical protein [Bradyrhizobium oligotrophicum]BAM88811.1 hypothetical protein S58_28050 [Bradyrhizobium oligotrophicum S58]